MVGNSSSVHYRRAEVFSNYFHKQSAALQNKPSPVKSLGMWGISVQSSNPLVLNKGYELMSIVQLMRQWEWEVRQIYLWSNVIYNEKEKNKIQGQQCGMFRILPLKWRAIEPGTPFPRCVGPSHASQQASGSCREFHHFTLEGRKKGGTLKTSCWKIFL